MPTQLDMNKNWLKSIVDLEVFRFNPWKENLKCSEILQLTYKRNLIEVFPNLKTSLKTHMTLPIKGCETERDFSRIPILIIYFTPNMVEERPNCLFILVIENEELIRVGIPKTVGKSISTYVMQLFNQNIILYSWILWYSWVCWLFKFWIWLWCFSSLIKLIKQGDH